MNNREPQADILDVATDADGAIESHSESETVPILDANAVRVIGHINTLGEEDRKREFAEADLYGSRRGDERQWGGLQQARTNLEARQAKLEEVDERILTAEELAEYRGEKKRVNQNLTNIVPKEEYARAFVNKSGVVLDHYTELSLNDFHALPEELQGAIRTGDQSIFEKYGVDSWAARQIGRSLEIREREEETKRRDAEFAMNGLLRRQKEGKTTWQDVASVLDTPNFKIFSGAEVQKVLMEQGLPRDGIHTLYERYQQEAVPSAYKPETLVQKEAATLTDIVTEGFRVGLDEEKRYGKKVDTEHVVQPIPAQESGAEVVSPPALTREEYVHKTPDVDEHVTPEMLEALKEAGIDFSKNPPVTAREAKKLWDKVLVGRATQQIEQNSKIVAQREAQKAAAEAKPIEAPIVSNTEPAQQLSGVYDIRDDGHIYNSDDASPDAVRLDADKSPLLATAHEASGALSSARQESKTPLYRAENGAVSYDRETDADLHGVWGTLNALMKNKHAVRPPNVSEPISQAHDPLLSGQYNIADGVVRTGFTEGEGQPVFAGDHTPHEGDPDKDVFNGLGILGGTPPPLADETIEPLIVHNFLGTPEFVSELDAQGEAMQHLIDSTPEVLNLGRTEVKPEVLREETEVEEIKATSDEAVKESHRFDPESELSNILKAPSAERKALLEAYKEKLAVQKIGLAKVEAAMVEDIRKNPDMTKEEFEKLFSERAEKYQATEEQRAIGSAIFEKFQAKHQAVEKARGEHPDDADLFTTLFGKAPKGEVEVIKGPMTLYFRCHDINDYALIDSGKCLKENVSITENDLKQASMSGGKGRVGTLIPELSGVVLAENADGKPFEGYARTTYEHEEQHAINGITQRASANTFNYRENNLTVSNILLELNEVQEKLNTTRASERDALAGKAMELKDKIKMLNVRELRATRKQLADKPAQDEILAYTRDGRDLGTIYKTLTKKQSDGGLYDFMSDDKTTGLSIWTKDSELTHELNASFDAQKKEIFETEYREVLKSGLDAYQKLRDAGYKEEAIRGIFHDEPLTRWGKVVDRLVKEDMGVTAPIAEKFLNQFNISKDELRDIEGLRDLSEGQQLLVLERMKSVVFDDINAEKVSRYRARIDELSKSSDWWDKVKSVGMKATKQFQLGRMKDEVSAEWLKGSDVDAVAMKRDALEGLVAQALNVKEFGVVEQEGELRTEYMSPEDFGTDAKLFAAQIARFNKLANRYANKSLGADKEAGDEGLKQKYESAADDMTRLLAEQTDGKWGGDSAAIWRTKMDTAVLMSRFFQDNPEVDAELQTAGRNISSAIGFKNLLVERSAYTLASGGARFLGVSALGLAALPAVAALGGGVMGWRRARQELSENDLLAAMGEKDTSDDKAHEKESGSNMHDRAKNVVSGHTLAMKLGNLLKEYNAADEATKLALKPRLEARVAYTTRKMEEQLVDMGSVRGDRVLTMSVLGMALGNAQHELGFGAEGENAIEARLNSILDVREDKIEANRKTHLVKQAVKGATMGAAFSGVGTFLGGLIPEYGKASSFGGGADRHFGAPEPIVTGESTSAEGMVGATPEITAPAPYETTIENIPTDGQVATVVYEVQAGDNLSHIMKAHLSIFNDLTPKQQENVIQNFIRDLSPQDMKDIGITDANHVNIGQQIQVDRLNEILAAKRIGGVDLIEHAQHLPVLTPHEEVIAPIGGESVREVVLSPLSPEDAAQIEHAFGRSLSGSESHVLHGLKGLSSLAESDAERQTIAAALDHLQKEMQVTGGHPLEMAEMQRILHEHNGLDAKIKFPEVLWDYHGQYSPNQLANLPEEVRTSISENLGDEYLTEDIRAVLGTDAFGNTSPEWSLLAGRSAERLLDKNNDNIFNYKPSIRMIREYVQAEGFTKENGYVPQKNESLESFLWRAHTLRILEEGTRPAKR